MLQVYIHALSREAESARMIGVCGLSTSLTDYEKTVIAHQADLLR